MLKLIIWIRPYSKYLLIVWVLVILLFSSLPSLPAIKIHTAKSEIRLDYLIHMIEYGILGFLTFLTFSGEHYKPGSRKYLIMTVSLVLFALLDEIHQKFIPGRAYNIKDLFSDTVGIVLALLFCVFIFRKLTKIITREG